MTTFNVKDLLREVKSDIKFDENPKIIKEEMGGGVTGGFLLHNSLTESECKQIINIAEEIGFEYIYFY
jgi:hypothetical protein